MFRLKNEALVKGLLLAGATVVLVGCGGGGGGGGGVPGGPTPEGGSTGGGSVVTEPTVTLSLTDLVAGTTSNSLSFGQNLKATALVLDEAGKPVPNAIVSFGASPDSLISLIPDVGTALTGADGKATIQLAQQSLNSAGAGTLTARSEVGGVETTDSENFSVSAANVSLEQMQVGRNPLSAYGTTSVSVDVAGVPNTVPITVAFTSNCAALGKANLTSSVISLDGKAIANYEDKGCARTDTITATVAGTAVSSSTGLQVEGPGISSIRFMSASPETIVLKGTGSAGFPEVSRVTFKVVDSNDAPIPNAPVSFSLSTATGGILLESIAVSGPSDTVTKSTGGDGTVQVSVQSGTLPTPVWVIASITDSNGKVVTTQSIKLSISTGRPAQDRMSLAVETHNIEGLGYDGERVGVTARLSDRLGNPVPDGAAVNFIASGAQIGATCQTEAGACSVEFVSSNPRLDGRIAILAYALGEESFSDLNSDNLYALAVEGPNFTDLGDAFLDTNEDGGFDAGEQSIPYGSGNSSCVNLLSTSPSAPSVAGTCDGVWGQAHVRQSSVIVLSGSFASASPRSFSMAGECSATFSFLLYDENGNPMPKGTEIAAITANSGFSSAVVSDDEVSDALWVGGTRHQVSLTRTETTGCDTAPQRTLPLEVTTPKGNVSVINMTITR